MNALQGMVQERSRGLLRVLETLDNIDCLLILTHVPQLVTHIASSVMVR
jgi:hypothetical protein